MEKFKSELINFIEKSTCSYTCSSEIKKELDANGFTELKEVDNWNIKEGKYYVIRNNTSVIAFVIPNNFENYFN